jgi:hypothetical protein
MIWVLFFRTISPVEYVLGNGLTVGTELYRQPGLDLTRFFRKENDKMEGRESFRMQEKQHLVNEGRKLKPPKELQK